MAMKRSALIDDEKIEYYLADPTGNITILVESFAPVENQPYIGKRLMEIEPSCEQVGFLYMVDINRENPDDISKNGEKNAEKVNIKLRMSAGEFCGNATMSTAALFFINSGYCDGDSADILVDSSGVKDPVLVNITKNADEKFYIGRVKMPCPRGITKHILTFEEENYELSIVDFGGINHIVMPYSDEAVGRFMAGANAEDENFRIKAENAVHKWLDDLKVESLGLIFVDDNNIYVNQLKLNPLVYVPDCGTCYWESSCGSGTTAVGAYYFEKNGNVPVSFMARQPGGTLTIEVNDKREYFLGGSIRFHEREDKL